MAPIVQRAVCRVPHGHWKTLSTIAAMSTRGMIAAASFDDATNTELFVQEELTPQATGARGDPLTPTPSVADWLVRIPQLVANAGGALLNKHRTCEG